MVAIIYEFNGKQYVSATTYIKLEKENKKLREFKAKQEEMMFLIGASIESAKPKTAGDAEKLQKGKELYEKLYKEELYSLKEENKKLKEKIDELEKCNLNLQERLDRKEEVNKKLREELSAYDREYFDEDKKANNIFIDKSGKVIKGGEFTTLC